MERTNLNPVSVVGVFSKVCAAGMTRGNILDVVRAAHRVEGTARTGAVSGARGQRSVEGRETVTRTHASPSFIYSGADVALTRLRRALAPLTHPLCPTW